MPRKGQKASFKSRGDRVMQIFRKEKKKDEEGKAEAGQPELCSVKRLGKRRMCRTMQRREVGLGNRSQIWVEKTGEGLGRHTNKKNEQQGGGELAQLGEGGEN